MISVLLPTTGRPEMAEECVQDLIKTTEGHEIELCLAIDCDMETIKRMKRLDVNKRMDLCNEYRGCSQAWNDALALSTGDPIVFAADDLHWEDGWLDAALECLSHFPDGWGLVGFNDGHMGAELSTHYLMSRRFIKEVLGGVVAWDHYQHSFNDLEVNQRARLADRYAWCEDAHVTHRHWTWGTRPKDETDERMLPGYADSQRIYQEREAQGFPTNYSPVI